MNERIFAIGDIHGCFDQFRELVEDKIRLEKSDKLVLLGDYIDRGPDSKKVLDFIIGLQNSGFDTIALTGNHEAMLVDAYFNPDRLSLWMKNGGGATLNSFGINNLSQLNPAYLNFFKELPLWYESDNYLFVHAGFNDSASDPFLDRKTMLWHSSEEYTHPKLAGKTIVHGHQTIQLVYLKESLLHGDHVINIDTGCVYKNIEDYGKLTAVELNSRTIISV